MKLKTGLLLILSVLSPAVVFGLGIRLPDQDAFATGRGEAFVATADNPSAIYYNPAGITQLDGQNARAGFYGIYLNDHFSGPGTSLDTKDSVQLAPQLYYTYGFQDVPLTLGLGLYAPYGLSIEWPENAPFVGLGPVHVTPKDINGDGRTDLIVADQVSNDVTVVTACGVIP